LYQKCKLKDKNMSIEHKKRNSTKEEMIMIDPKIEYYAWLELRKQSKDEDGEELCYCGHTFKCSCGDPDLTTFIDSCERGAIKIDDKNNGWIVNGENK